VLLDDDVVADGETETGPFASGLRREERIEYLFLHLKRHTSAIVANPDFHTVAKVPGGRYKGWLVVTSIRLCTALGRRVEAVEMRFRSARVMSCGKTSASPAAGSSERSMC
jgi:hypothetical protein